MSLQPRGTATGLLVDLPGQRLDRRRDRPPRPSTTSRVDGSNSSYRTATATARSTRARSWKAARCSRIEVDRNGDGAPDRFEFYGEAPPERVIPMRPRSRGDRARRRSRTAPTSRSPGESSTSAASSPASRTIPTTTAGSIGGSSTTGVLAASTWICKVPASPTARLVYRRDGSIDRVEVDPDGSGPGVRRPPDLEPSMTTSGKNGGSRDHAEDRAVSCPKGRARHAAVTRAADGVGVAA